MKLLFIHEVNYKTKVIFEMHEFPELMALKGHQVDFLHFPEGVGWKGARLTSKSESISGRVYQNARLRLITPPNFGGNFIDRLFSALYSIPTLFRLISRDKYDAVILYSVPTTGWQAALIARIRKVPIIYRALDVSHLLRSGLTRNLVRRAEKIVYRNVNLVSANNAALGKYCTSASGKQLKVEINYPPLDFTHFEKKEFGINLRNKYGIKSNDFVLLFLGTFYEFSGIIQVIEAFAKNYNPRIKIILVGGGILEPKIKSLITQLNLVNSVVLTGFIKYENLPETLAMANVAFNSFESTLISEVAFPHKVLQYLAAGIPTISTKLPGLYSALGENAGVIWVDKPEDIYSAGVQLMESNKDEITTIINLEKSFVKNEFDKDGTVNSFESMIVRAIEASE